MSASRGTAFLVALCLGESAAPVVAAPGLARRYKLHMGIDVAFGPDGTAFYVQFGSAWF